MGAIVFRHDREADFLLIALAEFGGQGRTAAGKD